MDVIRFERRRLTFPEFDVVVVFINDVEFLDLVRAYELPAAEAEGRAKLAGDYGYLEASDVAPPSRHFLGEPSSGIYQYGDRTQVLICDADYEPGCKPLVCRIEVRDGRVTWSSFERPRHPESHSGLGPFAFDQLQYEAALAALPSAPTCS